MCAKEESVMSLQLHRMSFFKDNSCFRIFITAPSVMLMHANDNSISDTNPVKLSKTSSVIARQFPRFSFWRHCNSFMYEIPWFVSWGQWKRFKSFSDLNWLIYAKPWSDILRQELKFNLVRDCNPTKFDNPWSEILQDDNPSFPISPTSANASIQDLWCPCIQHQEVLNIDNLHRLQQDLYRWY